MFLPAVRGFDGYGLTRAVDVGDGSIDRFEAILANVIDLDRCLVGAFGGVVSHYVGAFLESVKGVFGAHGCFVDNRFRTMDSCLVGELYRVLGTIRGLDSHRFRAGIEFGDGSVDGRDKSCAAQPNVLRSRKTRDIRTMFPAQGFSEQCFSLPVSLRPNRICFTRRQTG